MAGKIRIGWEDLNEAKSQQNPFPKDNAPESSCGQMPTPMLNSCDLSMAQRKQMASKCVTAPPLPQESLPYKSKAAPFQNTAADTQPVKPTEASAHIASDGTLMATIPPYVAKTFILAVIFLVLIIYIAMTISETKRTSDKNSTIRISIGIGSVLLSLFFTKVRRLFMGTNEPFPWLLKTDGSISWNTCRSSAKWQKMAYSPTLRVHVYHHKQRGHSGLHIVIRERHESTSEGIRILSDLEARDADILVAEAAQYLSLPLGPQLHNTQVNCWGKEAVIPKE